MEILREKTVKRDFKRKKPRDNDIDDWMITYGDLVTLVLTFFILIAAVSKIDPHRFERVAQSLSGAYNAKQEGIPIDLDSVYRMVKEIVNRSSYADKVNVEKKMVGVAVTFTGSSLFESGQADLKPEIGNIIDGLAEAMNVLPYEISVEGHTDDVPISSDLFPSNWELSTARASRIVRYLIRKNVDPTKISATGFADTKPVRPNKNSYGDPIPANRAANRRIEIIFLAG